MKNIIITKPQAGEYPNDFQHYFDLVPSNDLLSYFDSQTESVETLASSLDENELLFRYAPGKWSVKGVLAHVIDCERVYCYRALSFARGEKEPLPGFDENAYEVEAKADARNIGDIIDEYETTRAATVSLFQSFDEEM